jgi:hypothetical protein
MARFTPFGRHCFRVAPLPFFYPSYKSPELWVKIRPDETGERQAEMALVVDRLFQQGHLDERYAVIAKGLALLTGPDRSSGDFGGVTGDVRRLRAKEFLTYIAHLFAESFAANAAWFIDPVGVAHAAMRLQSRGKGSRNKAMP